MDKHIEGTLAGTLGFFWPIYGAYDLSGDPLNGYVVADETGRLAVRTLVPDGIAELMLEKVPPYPDFVVGATEHSGSLFFDFGGRHDNTVLGATRASTKTFQARAAIVGFSIGELKSADLKRLSVYFPGLTQWSQLQGSEVCHAVGPDGKPTSWTTTVRSAPEEVEPLSDGHELTLSTHWEVTGPDDRRVVYCPVEFGSQSDSALPWHTHIAPLMAVQDLLALAYQGFVVADGGRAELDLLNEADGSSTPSWWSHRLMTLPPYARPPESMTAFPSFYMAHIGGLPGVRRWVELRRDHFRAAGPLAHYMRQHGGAAESSLHDMAVAIEYWVTVNKATEAWAVPLSKKDTPVARLARHVGIKFTEWVGDSAKWSTRVWDHYSKLKHHPTLSYDAFEVALLAESAAVLLECALLDEVAGNNEPSTVILTGPRYTNLGYRISDMVKSS